jgi:ferredoxin-NADP reductase
MPATTVREPLRHRTLRRAAGLLDVAFGPHGIDRYTELLRPTWTVGDLRARVVAVAHPTRDTVALTLEPNGGWGGFDAGQHTMLTVEIDGVRHTRCYSMTGSARERSGLIDLTVKAHPEGLVSRHLFEHARVGMVVGLSPAQGEFTLPAVRPDRLLLLSGGSGITPVLSMLRTLCDEGHDRPVTFVHWSLTAAGVPHRAELERLVAAHPNVRLLQVFTDEPGAGDLDGFLTADLLEQIDPAWREAEAYVCGPQPLMDAARALFGDAGRADHVHVEAFALPTVDGAGAPTATGGTVRFAATGRAVPDDGRPVLVQAEEAGLAPASGCRMGICHTCTATLRCGTVRNVVTGETTTAGPTAGGGAHVRICVNAPVGDVELDL